MFKNMLERSWLSTIRKPSRTIILVLILFVMANMMLSTIAIRETVNESVKYAKDSLSGKVYLEPDMEAIHEKAMKDAQTDGNGNFVRARITRPNIPLSMVESIADSQYTKDFTYTVGGRANSNSFTPVETEEQKMRKQMEEMNAQPGNNIMVMGGGANSDMDIKGINSFAFIPEVESGNIKLSSGEIFDESTDGQIMISYDLANLNDLKVGNQITLTTIALSDDGEVDDVTLTIIGIYDTTTDGFNTNTIYMNPKTAVQFMFGPMADSETTNPNDPSVESIRYFLTSAEYKDVFLDEANAKFPNLKDDNLKLSIDDTAYQQMVGPIESVGSFATTILWVVMVAATVIITLIVTINVKDRHYEMGVLMSLGAKKRTILGQILIELMLVATVSFILSIPTGTVIAKSMGSSLLDNQIAMSKKQAENNYGRGPNAPGGMTTQSLRGGGPMMSGPISGRQSDAEPISEINVTPTVSDYALLFTTGYIIIILAMVIPSINILRYQPKTILTGKE